MNEDWQKRKRQEAYYEAAIAQILSSTGLRAPASLPADAKEQQRLGVAAHLKKCKALIFLIGDGCGAGAGFRQHTADFKNELLRRLIRRCRNENLPILFLLINEDWSSQVCTNPECLKLRKAGSGEYIRCW